MNILETCDLLRKELYNNGYTYGFYLDGVKYKPDFSGGFDRNYYNLSITIYRVQNPIDTMREKIGTCIESVMVMKKMLDEYAIPNKIWLLNNNVKNKYHTILTFNLCEKVVYLELTPQSNKSNYGKEIIYNSEQEFVSEYKEKQFDVVDVTEQIIVGERPEFLLKHMNKL